MQKLLKDLDELYQFHPTLDHLDTNYIVNKRTSEIITDNNLGLQRLEITLPQNRNHHITITYMIDATVNELPNLAIDLFMSNDSKNH